MMDSDGDEAIGKKGAYRTAAVRAKSKMVWLDEVISLAESSLLSLSFNSKVVSPMGNNGFNP
jgi:hypothetical protein